MTKSSPDLGSIELLVQLRTKVLTKKFEPKSAKIIDVVPGYYAKNVEQYYTEKYIQKFGYNNVRGGKYTNSLTLK